jgi:hypothetical protein
MPLDWERSGPGESIAAIESLETRLGMILPDDFRTFVREHGGGVPEANLLATAQADDVGVTKLLSLEGILETKERLGSRCPPAMIPVADAEGGNLILLSLPVGHVYFWDHELEEVDPFRFIANSFTAFWNALEPFDISSIKLQPGQDLGGWVDPELLREYGVQKKDS